MRIRFFRAFASNNSGAYVLLGRFYEAKVAEEAAHELNEVLAAEDVWCASRPEPGARGPFMTFAEKHGLPMQTPYSGWREGMRCEVLGSQVLLEGYAPDMPSTFVAWIAKQGGHVESEIIHAHGARILSVTVSVAYPGPGVEREAARNAAREAVQRFQERVRIDPEVQTSLAPRRWGESPREVHVANASMLVLAPYELTRASRAIRALAASEGVRVSFQVSEWIDDEGDPARAMTSQRPEQFDVLLDHAGPTPDQVSAAMAAVKNIPASLAASLLSNRPNRKGTTMPSPRRIAGRVTREAADELVRAVSAAGAVARIEVSTRGSPFEPPIP